MLRIIYTIHLHFMTYVIISYMSFTLAHDKGRHKMNNSTILLNDDNAMGEVKWNVDIEWRRGSESGSRTSEQILLLQINCGSWKLARLLSRETCEIHSDGRVFCSAPFQ